MILNRKRKGSSLIFTVIIFMFVMIVSGAMLSMVGSNYVERVVEGKRLQNLYGAESGLDTAYNVVVKTIDNANQAAYKEVEDFKNDVKDMDYIDYTRETDIKKKALYALYADLNYLKLQSDENTVKIEEDNKLIEELINYVFRNKFKDYIDNNVRSNVEGEKGEYWLSVTGSATTKQQVEYNGADIKFYNNKDFTEGSTDIKWGKIGDIDRKSIETSGHPKRQLVVKYKFDENGEIVIESGNYYTIENLEYYEKENTEIALESTFKENNASKRVGSNERNLRVIYTLTVPNYYEVTFKNSIVTNTKDIPGITIGGNLIVEDSDLNVYGDILVEGNSSERKSATDSLSKYTKGIFIDNSDNIDINQNKKINFYNNVFCRETINMEDNATVNVNRNVYAKNIYVNSKNTNDARSVFNVNADENSKLVLDNDFELNADQAYVNIRNFYGINDYNYDSNKSTNTKKSSSIIVNNQNTNSVLTINNNAYIRGVAHINTENGYKTGESVAVKGNYNAYSIPIDDDDTFTYDNPLQVLNGNINKKAEHFYQYWKNGVSEKDTTVNAKDSIDYGGVIFNEISNVHSIGAIVYGEVNGDGENKKIVKKIKKAEDSGASTSIDSEIKRQKAEYAKNVDNLNIGNQKPEKAYDTGSITIDSIFNEDIPNTIDGKNFQFMKGSHVIENTGEDSKALKKECVLIVDGDLTIKGNVDIEGDIIVLGNLKIESGNVNIKYNKSLTKDIQNRNLTNFYSVFGTEYGGNDLNTTTSENTESNASEFITKLWKVGK
ncbi:hypothetical protein [uncultured Clostridium sp.]|uniref:hypothetical protein n=1 Tax=uncultured Clostridium sp. TaxID=59620 RepID=UPI0025FBDD52|nr:hypothetical protein [uncultured Clostridium sp.]